MKTHCKNLNNYRIAFIFFLLTLSPSLLLFGQKDKPNIVFILTDDLGYGDLGCYGSTKIKTPYIDALAKGGMRFTDFYAGSTVCAPSRASLMTGLHTGHSFIRGNGEVPLRAQDSIIPQWLHTRGYRNGMVGKWGLGQAQTDGVPENKGWDFFSGHLHHVEGHYQHPDSAWQLLNGKTTKIKIPQDKFANEWFKDEAIRFLNDNKKDPFFLYVSFTLPHAELVVPNFFLNQYVEVSGNSKFAPEVAQKAGLHYGPQPYPKAAYAAMITQVDQYVGELVSTLKKLELDNNTIILFTSDNGTHIEGGRTKSDVEYFSSSGPLRGIKRDLYEGGIRVPFIVNWKEKIKPGTSSIPAAFWDVLPTLAQVAGLHQVPGGDGISLLPTFTGEKQQQHDVLYWEFYEGGFKQAIRNGNWKAIRFYKEATPGRTELYNLDADIGETTDLAQQHPNLVIQLQRLMDQQRTPSPHPLFQIK